MFNLQVIKIKFLKQNGLNETDDMIHVIDDKEEKENCRKKTEDKKNYENFL
jgi:hypothetical protein